MLSIDPCAVFRSSHVNPREMLVELFVAYKKLPHEELLDRPDRVRTRSGILQELLRHEEPEWDIRVVVVGE